MNEICLTKKMEPKDAAMLGALELAYVGDCIFELLVRTHLLQESGCKVKELHSMVVKHVCAAGQAALAHKILPLLTEQELSVFKRGRNHRHPRIPKGSSPAEYGLATAFESLMGYLYLCGQTERLEELVALSFAE